MHNIFFIQIDYYVHTLAGSSFTNPPVTTPFAPTFWNEELAVFVDSVT